MASTQVEVQAAIQRVTGARRREPAALGAVDGRGRVAWIEAPDDIASLFVAVPDRPILEVKLALSDPDDYGYEGCWATYLEWFGDAVVTISHERSRTLLWSVRIPDGVIYRISLGNDHAIDGDLVLWTAEEPLLLRAAGLPSLDARTPLPIRTAARHVSLSVEPIGQLRVRERMEGGRTAGERLALPTGAQRCFPDEGDDFFPLLERALFGGGPVLAAARLIVEAIALPFCRDVTDTVYSPIWLPVYWHRHLVASGQIEEARRFLALLDAIAAPLPEDEPERGWDPVWNGLDGSLRLAARHVRRVSRLQASACRRNVLPRGFYCLLFVPAPDRSEYGSRVDPSRLPQMLRRAFEVLAPTCPSEIPHVL